MVQPNSRFYQQRRRRHGNGLRCLLLHFLVSRFLLWHLLPACTAFSFAPTTGTSLSVNKRRIFRDGARWVRMASPLAAAPKGSRNPTTESHQTSSASPKSKKQTNNHNNNRKKHWKSNNSKHKKNQSWQAVQESRRINQEIVKCTDVGSLMSVLQAEGGLTQAASGGSLNSVNFSTGLHRLARHSVGKPDVRARVLADPRFALLLACLAEALQRSPFAPREISNINWALAKLKLPPPTRVMAPAGNSNEATMQQMQELSSSIRQAVLHMAAQRRQGVQTQPTWVPMLSQLTGHVLDHLGHATIDLCSQAPSKNPRECFCMQEYANLMWSFSTAGRASPRVFDNILKSMFKQQRLDLENEDEPRLQPQEWSNSIWAVATAQMESLEHSVDLLEFTAELMETYPEFVDRFKPQEMANTAWGVATILALTHKQSLAAGSDTSVRVREEKAALTIIRYASSYIARRGASNYKSQELSNSVWALATIGFGLASASPTDSLSNNNSNNYIVLESDDPVGDRDMLMSVLQEVVECMIQILPRFRSQELNNVAWSLARLIDGRLVRSESSFERLLRGIGSQLSNTRRPVSSQDIGTSLWSFATLEYFDEDLYRALVARLQVDRAHTYKPQELSNTLWALATAEFVIGPEKDAFDTSLVKKSMRPRIRDPVVLAFAIAAREVMRRPQQFKAQEIKDVLWSFSKCQIRHPQLFKWVAEYITGGLENYPARGFDEFSPQGFGNTAWSYARQALLSSDVDDRVRVESSSASGNGRLSVYTTSYFDVGEDLLHRFFYSLGESNLLVHNQLQRCKPQDLANSAWAFAALGLKHESYMETIRKEVADRTTRFVRGEVNLSTQFKGQELANIVWALATLNIDSADLLECVTAFSQKVCRDASGDITPVSITKMYKRQELANMAWACAVFGKYPPALMRILYMGLVGLHPEEQDCSKMAEIHGDGGLQHQAITTLIYVQTSLDVTGQTGMSLPRDFPDAWKERGPSQNDHMTDTFDELQLSTSKMQRAVSKALTTIGFEHVEEHVITMEELVDVHGVNLSPIPMEVLSIDIADPHAKIGIEVDGPAHYVSRLYPGISMEKEGFVKRINGNIEYQFSWTGDRQEVNGSTALKTRLLQALGWTVINLPFWEWYELKGDEEAEQEYCRQLLNRAMSSP